MLYTGLGAGAGAAACFPAECSGAAAVVEVEGRRAVDRVVSLATGGGREVQPADGARPSPLLCLS